MTDALALPRCPSQVSEGHALPLGTYYVQPVEGGDTVQRTIGMHLWFPLTARENPAWVVWPSYEAARSWMTEQGENLCDFPFWGRRNIVKEME